MANLKKILTSSVKPIYFFSAIVAILLGSYFFGDIAQYTTSLFPTRQVSLTAPPVRAINVDVPPAISTTASTTADETEDAEQTELSEVLTFTRANADSRLDQIQEALASFSRFTDLVRTKSNLNKDYKIPLIDPNRIPKNARIISQFSGEDLLAIGNLDWETQNLGFANWPKSIKGHMDYQAYEIAKLKLEIAQLKNQPADQIHALEQDAAQKEKYLRDAYMSSDAWVD